MRIKPSTAGFPLNRAWRLGVWLVAASLFLGGFANRAATTSGAATLRRILLLRPGANQQPAIPSQQLRLGESLNREINRGEHHLFTIELAAGQCARLVIEWQGIDLAVTIYDPELNKLQAHRVLVSAPGPGSFLVPAGAAGSYGIEVSSLVKWKVSGTYQIKFQESGTTTPADLTSFAAQKLVAESSEPNAPEPIKRYEQAKLLWQSVGDLDGEAQTEMLMGDAYTSAKDLTKATECYDRAAEIWSTKGYLRGKAYAKISLAIVTRRFGAPANALQSYSEAQALFAQIGDRRGEASAFFGAGLARLSAGETPRALESLNAALEIRRAEGDRVGQANTLNAIGDSYRLLGDYGKALDSYQQATEAVKGLEFAGLETAIKNNTLLVYDDQGDWQKANEGYAQALADLERNLGKPVDSCSAAGSTSDQTVNAICESACSILDNLGETYNSLGEPAKAVTEFKRSLAIRDKLEQPKGQGSTRLHLGYAYFLLNDPTTALDHYREALRFQEKAADENGKALTYTYMGMAQAARNEPEEALKNYEKAKPILEDSADKRRQAIFRDKLASGYRSVGRPTEAFANYRAALELWRAIKDPDGEALTLHNMSMAESETGSLIVAHQYAEASTNLIESLRTRISSNRLRTSYMAEKHNYYQLDIDLNMRLSNSENREVHLAAAIESNEKGRARVLLDALSEAGVDRAAIEPGSSTGLASLIQQRAELLDRLGTKAWARMKLLNGAHSVAQIASIDKDVDEITAEYDELEARIRSQSPRFSALIRPLPSTLKEIQQQLDDNTVLLEYSLGEQRSYVWAVTPDSIKGFELAGRKEIEDSAELMIKALTERNRKVEHESPVQWQLRRGRADTEYTEASAALSKMVIEPVAALLGNKRLVIVPDGALQLIPFQALPDPQSINPANGSTTKSKTTKNVGAQNDPKLLVEDHEIVYEASASVLALQRKELGKRQPARHALAVLADPVFDQEGHKRELETRRDAKARERQPQSGPDSSGSSSETNARTRSDLTRAIDDMGIGSISSLPQSREEADAIMKLVPKGEGMEALGFDASRATVMSPDLSQYRIIHFATHGFADPNHPELSGIVLSLIDEKGQPQNGYLRLHDIYNLNLPADLVVLSACETGVGKRIKGEGLIALTRGFTYAGAASVVASLWKVDDEATRDLMEEFYKQMFTNGRKPAAALQKAQLKLAHKSQWRSPFYWAGFVLQGEWK